MSPSEFAAPRFAEFSSRRRNYRSFFRRALPCLFSLSFCLNAYFSTLGHSELLKQTQLHLVERNASTVHFPLLFVECPHDSSNRTAPVEELDFLEIMSLEATKKRKWQVAANLGKRPELISPTKDPLSPDATFSACLLVKDDNDILSEWIAYHYHVLSLRQLIVAVDPDSRDLPWDVLNKWNLLTDLEILQWSDDQYMPQTFLKNGQPPDEYLEDPLNFEGLGKKEILQISNHRYRQHVFLAQCLKKQKELGSRWTMHIDTDEFVVPSKFFRDTQPTYVKMQPLDEPGSTLHLLQQVTALTPTLVNYPCISMLRLLYGSMEMNDGEGAVRDSVPDGFNSTTFETLRWRHHAPPQNMSYHGNPKVILDLSVLSKRSLKRDLVFSIHRPMVSYCKKNEEIDYDDFYSQPLATNHYLGSYERYSARSDNRRNRQMYDQKAFVNDGTDDGTRLWLKGFVKNLGVDSSIKLLGKEHLTEADLV